MTVCADGMFSQGEWQLLSIARAAAANPKALLLDEITANLDAATAATFTFSKSKRVKDLPLWNERKTHRKEDEIPSLDEFVASNI